MYEEFPQNGNLVKSEQRIHLLLEGRALLLVPSPFGLPIIVL